MKYTIHRDHLYSALFYAVETLETDNKKRNMPEGWKSTSQQVLEEALETLRNGEQVEIRYD